jgi:hypothetical protein
MLDPTARGVLEKTIDEAITSLPGIAKKVRVGGKNIQIQNNEDYSLGVAVGYIIGRLGTMFLLSYGRLMDDSEQIETGNIIFHRTAELREGLFRAG